MSIQELEAEALKLPESERAQLAELLLASLGSGIGSTEDDPILGLGTAPVVTGVIDGSVNHDRYLYGRTQP